MISGLTNYEGLPALRVLNLRHNRIENIGEELPELPALETLNLRTNKVPDMENIVRLLSQFSTIKNLNVLNCPVEMGFSSMNILISEILKVKPDMTRFCKVDITDPLRLENVFLAKYKWTKSEEERIAKEKAEAEAAAKAEEEQG